MFPRQKPRRIQSGEYLDNFDFEDGPQKKTLDSDQLARPLPPPTSKFSSRLCKDDYQNDAIRKEASRKTDAVTTPFRSHEWSKSIKSSFSRC